MSENTPTGYYSRHIFFCLNEEQAREDHTTVEGVVTEDIDNLAGKGQVRVNKAGCLDRCAAGPVAVVYPEGTWYTFVDTADIDEIVESHLKNGQVVERLLVPPELGR